MNITEIRIFKAREIEEGSNFRGTASITIDGCFVIHNIGIIEGRNGLFLSFPDRRLKSGRFVDVAHPITAEARDAIEKAVIAEYNAAPAE